MMQVQIGIEMEQRSKTLVLSARTQINLGTIYMSLVVRKPVFGVSDQVPHKPGCAITEDG